MSHLNAYEPLVQAEWGSVCVIEPEIVGRSLTAALRDRTDQSGLDFMSKCIAEHKYGAASVDEADATCGEVQSDKAP